MGADPVGHHGLEGEAPLGQRARGPVHDAGDVNAILCQARTGCQWRCLQRDLPPKSAVYYYFALWRDDGTAETIHDLLRRQAREMRKRHEDPTAVVLDFGDGTGLGKRAERTRPGWIPVRRARAASGASPPTSSA
ncbi:transposase [Streptomyces sp. YIM S03343]